MDRAMRLWKSVGGTKEVGRQQARRRRWRPQSASDPADAIPTDVHTQLGSMTPILASNPPSTLNSARAEACLRAAEQRDHRAHLFRATHAPNGMCPTPLLDDRVFGLRASMFGCRKATHWRVDRSGTHGIHPNAVAGVIERHRGAPDDVIMAELASTFKAPCWQQTVLPVPIARDSACPLGRFAQGLTTLAVLAVLFHPAFPVHVVDLLLALFVNVIGPISAAPGKSMS